MVGSSTIIVVAVPITFSASSCFCSPRRIEIKAVAPTPISTETAISMIIIGKATVVAAMAKEPMPRPRNILSTIL